MCLPSDTLYVCNRVVDGVVCTGLMGDGVESGRFLVAAGIASHDDQDASNRYRYGPCLVIPTLKEAWKRTDALMSLYPEKDRADFRKHVGRRA